MTSRRQQVLEYYLGTDLRKAAAAVVPSFNGPGSSHTVVVRTDINGYSDWVRNKNLSQRAALLNDFFGKTIPALERFGGVYFRDEGDCILSLFSKYFGHQSPYKDAESFCKCATITTYGPDALTSKCVVATGTVAYYQKQHEVPVGDWSAEGDPFIRAARLEYVAESKQHIHYFAEEYDRFFKPHSPFATPGQRAYWMLTYESRQVEGLHMPGGWSELAIQKYLPQGEIVVGT